MFKNSISLADADTIATTALSEGSNKGFNPLTVVVLDNAGVIKVMKRADGSSLTRPEIAVGKAYGCLTLGFGGREMARRAEKMPAFMNALTGLVEGKVVPVQGGVLIKDAEGYIVGAVGVTGDLSANDELCAVAGIEAAGLVADTGDA
ncbi:GlcG/HbpS family heme-binding protein [Rhodospirillum sp. A1_3_36]|uniref:GlcG/HbpS family heme-binding protein n=1 Tax=Rhodospirillum sp. A1_3_36 TaxID=3391666 RepID=UPI0039A6F202